MKKLLILLPVLILIAGGVWVWQNKKGSEDTTAPSEDETPPEVVMEIKSSAFKHNSNIPSKYSCDDANVNPPLSISGVPESAQSLALIVDDPDAPGGIFTHWTVWNISSQATEIAEDSVPQGAVEGGTDFGKVGWGGPCPPSGTHHYFFKLYALDIKLNLARGASKTDLTNAMKDHILEESQLIGLYAR